MSVTAAFQTINPEDVPATRGEVLKFLDDWRQKLSASEAAIRNVDHIIDAGETVFTRFPSPVRKVLRPLFRRSVIATYPRWMRPMLGVKQSGLTDQAMFWLWKPLIAVAHTSPRFICWVVKQICPRALRYIKPVYYNIPADSPRVYTPEVARRMFGNPLTPLEQREELLKKRQEGVGQTSYGHNHHDEILEFAYADDVEAAAKVLDAIEEVDLREVHKAS